MRWNGSTITIFLAALAFATAPALAAGFGTVVPIGGHAADIALDETRGALYVANFAANRIDVVSTASNAVSSSINVAPQPGALALSRDGQYLLVAHYGNWNPADPMKNLITLIDMVSRARQTFAMGAPPLGVTFLQNGRALIVTAKGFVLFDPFAGTFQSVDTFANLSIQLPLSKLLFPPEILLTAVASSGDGLVVWGIGSADAVNQMIYRYDSRTNRVAALTVQASVPLLPRVSVNSDGSRAMVGYAIFGSDFQRGVVEAQYPDVQTSTNVTGSVFGASGQTIYAQIPNAGQPAGPPYTGALTPRLAILDADNLTIRERVSIPENITGRAVLNSAGTIMYAASDSGALALPVGSLNQYPRVAINREDLMVQAGFCDRRVISMPLTITDPGGGNTAFAVSVDRSGVSVSPTSGVTPATVQVRIDPAAFQNQTGTTAIPIVISSPSAINAIAPVRLLVNNRAAEQRGTIVNVPGRLSDMLTDAPRSRIYLLRQDTNELLIYDGTSYGLITRLRTGTTPTRMAFSADRTQLMVGHDNSQLVYVYDLEKMQRNSVIRLPLGEYARSLAASNKATLAVVRTAAAASMSGGVSAWIGASNVTPAYIDNVDLGANIATPLPSMGIWENSIPPESALSPSQNGATILLAQPDGIARAYSADADTFIASRNDVSSFKGSFAASSYETYVVGNNVLNRSLVPTGALDESAGVSVGFAFVESGGLRVLAASASGPGAVQNHATLTASGKPTAMVEAPLGPQTGMTFTRSVAPLAFGYSTIVVNGVAMPQIPTGAAVIALTASGFTALSWYFDAAVSPPVITSVVNAADGTAAVAPGGLISIYGQQMNPVNLATRETPLPTALGESCVTVNGAPIPLLFVSDQQINAQLPNGVSGRASLVIRTPGGTSDTRYLNVYPSAPSVFRTGTAGPLTGLATIVRWNNHELVTATNPVHQDDYLEIYLTGMGATVPEVEAGHPAPSSPLAIVSAPAVVSLGGQPLEVIYAGLAPGLVGVYQVNAKVSGPAPAGLSVPLSISQGGMSTSVNVRVVK